MSKNNPLAEVFGFPISNESETAQYYRENRLCPYHNRFPNCTKSKADIAWFLYDLKYNEAEQRNHLVLVDTVYTEFQTALEHVIYTKPGNMADFLSFLQGKLDERISNEPETRSILDLL